MSNITFGEKNSYERLFNNFREKEGEEEKDVVEEVHIDKSLLKVALDNLQKSYNFKPEKRLYDSIVTLESIISNLSPN